MFSQQQLAAISAARRELEHAESVPDPPVRYVTAHKAAAMLATVLTERHRTRTRRVRSRQARPLSVWALLAVARPDLKPFAVYYADAAKTRAAIQAGITRLATPDAVAGALDFTRRFFAAALDSSEETHD